jgi:hypothetical protein
MKAVLCFALWLALPLPAAVRAGAARVTVTADLARFSPIYIGGFGQNRVATGVHDELWARCLALDDGRGPVVLCGVDSVGLFLDDVERIRAAAGKRAGGIRYLLVAALHDHEAPDTMGLWGASPLTSGIHDGYMSYLVDRIAQAAVEAVTALAPARLQVAASHPADLDSFIADDRPPRVHDAELIVLRAADTKGRTIATLVNWANHPETLGSKNTLLTADYPAALYTRLEERLGGVVVFLNGAVGGMQSPLNATVIDPATSQPAEKNSFRKAELIGRRVAEAAAEALAAAKPVAVDRIETREAEVFVPLTNPRYRAAGAAGLFGGRKVLYTKGREDSSTAEIELPGMGKVKASAGSDLRTVVGLIRLSRGKSPVLDVALVPGELYPELSVGGIERYAGADFPDAPLDPAIKTAMRAPFRMLVGLANDEIGYIIPRAEWDEQAPWLQNAPRRWYGEVNSVGPQAAPVVVNRLVELIRKP